jgi:signal transduction histidine kinase
MCTVKTNTEKAGWSRRYQMALRKHLKEGPRSSQRPATRLGRQAAALGLEPLDVARIHEITLATLKSSGRKEGILKRAGIFFAEAITPIEQTHRAALSDNRHVKQLTATLKRRTSGLAVSKRRVKLRISQRKNAEEALKISGEHYAKLLKESHRLQEHLRHLTHRIFSAHENEKKRVSLELQDEIAQTLLGINVRLLTLSTGAAVDAHGLKKEVASTQRLVGKSAKLMARYSHELGSNHET